ncbi:hypothetical protein FB45DRAFT_892201 [Roridomyces roridus]|uniref:Uncharacterized protein n=1 Tax=Roridomyces roridus TaxID=1738132 RepID=A0AAD7CER8_9AGAR|nr:hypothetical protein FB45DRAFT_892201 [Roridomyces roridus]
MSPQTPSASNSPFSRKSSGTTPRLKLDISNRIFSLHLSRQKANASARKPFHGDVSLDEAANASPVSPRVIYAPPGLSPPQPPRYPAVTPTKGFTPVVDQQPPPTPAPLPTLESTVSYEGDISEAQDGDASTSFDNTDYILEQLENLSQMDDSTLAHASIPSVCDSIWATCPSPAPSPGALFTARLNRKQSHALLNYLLVECGYDLGSLNSLTARFPVPRPEIPVHVPPTEATIENAAEYVGIDGALQVEASEVILPAPIIPVHYPDPPRHSLASHWKISQYISFPVPPPKPKAKPSFYHHVIESAESIAAPPQSGHGYLQSNGINVKTKVKTRPDTSTVRPPGVALTRTSTGSSLMKPNLVSRVLRPRKANQEEERKSGTKWWSKLSKMSKATTDQMRVLFKGNGDARELSWTGFLTIMKELGFTHQNTHGNSFKFYPPSAKDPAIVLSRPSDKVFHKKQLAELRKKLLDKYSWISDGLDDALGA